MKVEREIDSEHRIAILKVVGELRDDDLLSLARHLEEAPQVASDFALLIDLREADGRQVSIEAVRALAVQPLVLSPTSRRAVVVPSELGYGMARMYELLREGRGSVQAFRDYEAARRWVAWGTA